MASSAFVSYSITKDTYIQAGNIALSFLVKKIATCEARQLDEINKISDYNSLLESVINNKISIFEIIEEPLKNIVPEKALIIDKSFLHLRLGLLYKDEGKIDMADKEFKIALDIYNLERDDVASFKDMSELFHKLNSKK